MMMMQRLVQVRLFLHLMLVSLLLRRMVIWWMINNIVGFLNMCDIIAEVVVVAAGTAWLGVWCVLPPCRRRVKKWMAVYCW
jgi:hypothetical protein